MKAKGSLFTLAAAVVLLFELGAPRAQPVSESEKQKLKAASALMQASKAAAKLYDATPASNAKLKHQYAISELAYDLAFCDLRDAIPALSTDANLMSLCAETRAKIDDWSIEDQNEIKLQALKFYSAAVN